MEIVTAAVRLLTFRATAEELRALDRRHLAFGLAATWLVGIGRYWDAPNAELLQYLGLGSVLYVFVLSLLLWLIVLPIGPANWSYRGVLTFVTLTAPPAILYAIPVERFLDLGTARSVNVWFLAVVAVWRVALLVSYLVRVARLSWYGIVVAALLPLTLIVTVLTAFNLEKAVFNVMGGLQSDGTANDHAYAVLFLLTMLSTMVVIPLLVAYGVIIVRAQIVRRRLSKTGSADSALNDSTEAAGLEVGSANDAA